MVSRRIVTLLTFKMIFVGILSCQKSQTVNQVSANSVLQGSVSQSPPGGTLLKRDFSQFDCTSFHEAVWFRLSKPVGAMIWHQYIGLRITTKGSNTTGPTDKVYHEFQTSGLSDPSDLENLKSWWKTPGAKNDVAHLLDSKRYRSCESFLDSVNRINKAMRTSQYQYAGVRIIAMVIAPVPVLGGRPCAREAQAGTETWLSSDTSKQANATCDFKTVIIPDAKWSKTSVDWDDSAFNDAETSTDK